MTEGIESVAYWGFDQMPPELQVKSLLEARKTAWNEYASAIEAKEREIKHLRADIRKQQAQHRKELAAIPGIKKIAKALPKFIEGIREIEGLTGIQLIPVPIEEYDWD